MNMSIKLLTSYITNHENYSEPIIYDNLSFIPFIDSFAKIHGKEYLHSLLNISSIKNLTAGESLNYTSSIDTIFIYLQGTFHFYTSTHDDIDNSHIAFGQPIIPFKKKLYSDCIIIKVIKPCTFLQIIYSKYNDLLENILINKTKKIIQFSHSLKDFKIFHNIKYSVNEKLYKIAQHKYYYRNDIVYLENSPVDGIYFIIQGSFLLTKKQPKITDDDKINQIDKELKYLSKENEIYMKCAFGKNAMNSKPIQLIKQQLHSHKYLLGDNDNRKLITKSFNSSTRLGVLNEGKSFGDIELISTEPLRSYSIKCTSDKGEAIYFPHEEFKQICTDVMLEKLKKEVLNKASIFSSKYYADINIKENKCTVDNYLILPTDINEIHLDRNNNNHIIQSTKISSSTLKLVNTTYYKFNLPSLEKNNNKRHNQLVFSNDDKDRNRHRYKHKKSQSSYYNTNLITNESECNDNKMITTSTHIKNKYKLLSDNSMMMFLNSDNNTNANTSNIESQYTQNITTYFPPSKKQDFALTKMKYPVSSISLKKKISFHFKDKENNLKEILLKNNLRQVKVAFIK